MTGRHRGMPGAALMMAAHRRTLSAATLPGTRGDDGLRSIDGAGLETRHDFVRDRALEQLLDGSHQLTLIARDQRDGGSLQAGPACPADAVDVVLRDGRQLEVHDVRKSLDVEAASGDIRRHQDLRLAPLEGRQCAYPL
jgi:hypothetical protein